MTKLNILPDMAFDGLVLSFFIVNDLISWLDHYVHGFIVAILLDLEHDVAEVTLRLLLGHQQIVVDLDVKLAVER